MKPVFLGLAAAAAMMVPAAHVFAGACGGGRIDSPDTLTSHVVVDLIDDAPATNAGNLAFVESQFDPGLSAEMPAEDLAGEWAAYSAGLGRVQRVGSMTDVSRGDFTVVTTPLQFEHGGGAIQIIVDPNLAVASLVFLPGLQPS